MAIRLPLLPGTRYTGPDFEEYCISEGRFLPASRDRVLCATCALSALCQCGFDEQICRIERGDNPSLTEGALIPTELTRERLLAGLTPEQADFVLEKLPNL